MNSKQCAVILLGTVFLTGLMQGKLLAGVNFDLINNGVYEIQIIPDDQAKAEGEATFADQLTVKYVIFTLEKWNQKGLSPLRCALQQGRDISEITFQCFGSSNEEDLRFAGAFEASLVSGTLVYTKADGQILKYTFTGERKTANKQQ